MPSTVPQDLVRRTSKTLFRNSYMLEVCAEVARALGRVNLTTLVDAGRVTSASLYSGNVNRLVHVGLLVPDPHDDDDRREKWYRRTDSRLWSLATELDK